MDRDIRHKHREEVFDSLLSFSPKDVNVSQCTAKMDEMNGTMARKKWPLFLSIWRTLNTPAATMTVSDSDDL